MTECKKVGTDFCLAVLHVERLLNKVAKLKLEKEIGI
jgi:hypothetical protein